MIILQINVVYDEKSTGRTCKEVENYLLNRNVKCITAYGVGDRKKGENSYRIDWRAEYVFHNFMSRLTGLEGYFSYFATRRLISYISKVKPDVIHLRNLHGHYLNLPLIFKYLKKTQIPVIVNLHDCWIFTGKCTYPIRTNCNKWMKKCNNCIAKKEYPTSWLFDFSKKMHNDKINFFEGINLRCIIGVSEWVADQAKKSFLGKYPVKHIYNWIDSSIFHPYDVNEVYDLYKLERNRFTVICVAAAWKENSAKNSELIKLAHQLGPDTQIIVVGKNSESITGNNVFHIGFLSDTTMLAKLYSASNVYVHLSAADTFGKVLAEAMACGIPVVAYDCTACSELVKDGCGYLVPLHDVDKLCAAVNKVREIGTTSFSRKCIERVRCDFDYKTNCKQLLDTYLNGE